MSRREMFRKIVLQDNTVLLVNPHHVVQIVPDKDGCIVETVNYDGGSTIYCKGTAEQMALWLDTGLEQYKPFGEKAI